MSEGFVAINIGFFILMGITALARPESITGYFGLGALTLPMRNEVRAVYGGFGLAVAGVLGAALVLEPIREGVLLTVGVALLGMASGRVFSFAADRNAPRFPLLFLFVELGLGGSLVFAFMEMTA